MLKYNLTELYNRSHSHAYSESRYHQIMVQIGALVFDVLPDGVYLAGGSVRRLIRDEPLDSDFDFFFKPFFFFFLAKQIS